MTVRLKDLSEVDVRADSHVQYNKRRPGSSAINCSTPMVASVVATDEFNRANAETLGAPWVEYSLSTPLRSFLHIFNNQLRYKGNVALNSPRVARWNGPTIPTSTTHQKSKVTIGSLEASGQNKEVAVCVRMVQVGVGGVTPTNIAGYEWHYRISSLQINVQFVRRSIAGVRTTLYTTTTLNPDPGGVLPVLVGGDEFSLQAVNADDGSICLTMIAGAFQHLYVEANSVAPAIAAGQPGVGTIDGLLTSSTAFIDVDHWEGSILVPA